MQLELTGVKQATSKLKQFEADTAKSMSKAGRMSRDAFGNMKTAGGAAFEALGKGLKGLRSLLNSVFAKLAAGALVFATLNDTVKKVLALDRAQVSLNQSLGANSVRAYDFATKAAKKYGLGIETTVSGFAKFTAAATAANIPLKVQEDLFEAVTKSAVVFGMSAEETKGAFYALQQMASKGFVSMEELRRQLGERVPIALAAAARGFGVTNAKLIEMVESGKLSAEEFFPALTKGLNELTGGEINTLSVQLGQLKAEWEELMIAFGQDFAIPMLTKVAEVGKRSIKAIKELGVRRELVGPGQTHSAIFKTGAFSDEAGVAAKAVEMLQNSYGKFGLTQKKAIEAYKQAVASGEKMGSWQAMDKAADIAIKMTSATRDKQDLEQKEIADAARANKEAKLRKDWEEASLKTIDKTTKARKKELDTLIKSRQEAAKAQGLTNTSDAVGALGGYAQTKLKQEQAQQKMMIVADSKSTSDADRQKIYEAFNKSVEATKNSAKEAAFLITEAYDKAKKAADDAAKKLSGARTQYADVISDKNKGVGRYMSGQGNALRQEKAMKILQSEAQKARSRLLKSMGPGDIRRDFAANTSQFGSKSVNDIGALKEFIDAVNTELGAADGVESAQKELTTANKDLENVIKVQTDATTALGAPLEALSNQFKGLNDQFSSLSNEFNALISKDWNVFVNVPGGSATGDATTVEEVL